MKEYGNIVVNEDSGKKEIAITDFTQLEFKDNRFITISETELNTYAIAIENLKSSGRDTMQILHLTEETMIGLVTSVMIHLNLKNKDLDGLMKRAVNNDGLIKYKTTIEE